MSADQAPQPLGFSRQEHRSGLPFPSPMHESEITQSCPTLSNPMDCSQPGSSIHGIFQARVLEWGVIAFFWACLVPYFSKNPVKSQFSHNPLFSIIWSSLVTDQIPYTYLSPRWCLITVACLQEESYCSQNSPFLLMLVIFYPRTLPHPQARALCL